METALISAILVIIASGCTIITTAMKDMRKILFFILMASIITAINYFVSESSGGVSAYLIATAVTLTSGIFAIKKKPVPLFVIILYCIAYVVANIFAYEDWYTIFATVGAITGVIGTTREDGMSYRIWILTNSILWVCYDVFAHAYGPLAQHLIFTAFFTGGLVVDIIKKTKENKESGCNISDN